MKRILSLFLSVVMLLGITAGLNLSVYANISGDFEYEVIDDGTAEITHYNGSASELTIPSTLDGYNVTSINDYTFEYCKSLTSVTIPDSVTSIGNRAFSKCKSLTSITMPDSITSIGPLAFYDTAYYNDESNWDNGVLYISNYLIEANENISGSYIIKDNTRVISDAAFYQRDLLTSVTIPGSVTSIGGFAFFDCDLLTNVTIPGSVTSIGDYVFSHCVSLTSVTFGNGVTSIDDSAFNFCDSLTSVTIPDSVTSIESYAFCNCYSLTDVYYSGSKDDWYQIRIASYNELLTNAKIHCTDGVINEKPIEPEKTIQPTQPEQPIVLTQPANPQPTALTQPITQPTTQPSSPASPDAAKVSKPKATKISRLTKGKKQFKASWKKVSGISGYQIQYSTSKKFTKKASKSVTVKGSKKTSATVKKLKSKKKYYVRIRTYKNIKLNGKTVKVYSSWSKAKTVTTK